MPPISMPEDRLRALDKMAKDFYQEATRALKSSQGEYTAEEMEMLLIHMMLTLAQDMQANKVSVTDMANRIRQVTHTMETTFNAKETSLFEHGRIIHPGEHFNLDNRTPGR